MTDTLMLNGLIELGWFGDKPTCDHEWKYRVEPMDGSELGYFQECTLCGETKEES